MKKLLVLLFAGLVLCSGEALAVSEDAPHVNKEPLSGLGCRSITTDGTSAGSEGDWATVDCDPTTGALKAKIVSSTVGCTSADDDGSIPGATTNDCTTLVKLYAWDGSAYSRLLNFTGVEDAAETAGGGLAMVGTVRRDTAASSAGTSGDNATLNTDALGRLWVRRGGPCSDHDRVSSAVINESTAATNEIVALNGSDLIYVCGYKWVTTAANSLNWVYGTGTDCNTGTTSIEGPQAYGANTGAVENGGGAPLFVVPAGKALCLTSTVATQHGGRVTYVRTAAP